MACSDVVSTRWSQKAVGNGSWSPPSNQIRCEWNETGWKWLASMYERARGRLATGNQIKRPSDGDALINQQSNQPLYVNGRGRIKNPARGAEETIGTSPSPASFHFWWPFPAGNRITPRTWSIKTLPATKYVYAKIIDSGRVSCAGINSPLFLFLTHNYTHALFLSLSLTDRQTHRQTDTQTYIYLVIFIHTEKKKGKSRKRGRLGKEMVNPTSPSIKVIVFLELIVKSDRCIGRCSARLVVTSPFQWTF